MPDSTGLRKVVQTARPQHHRDIQSQREGISGKSPTKRIKQLARSHPALFMARFRELSADAKIAASKWRLALKNALRRRLTSAQLQRPLAELTRKYRLPGQSIAQILMSFRGDAHQRDDPLLFQYARLLLQNHNVDVADLLVALLPKNVSAAHGTSIHARNGGGHDGSCGLPSCDERIFLLLTEVQFTTPRRSGPLELQRITHALARWLHMAYEHESAKQLTGDILHTTDHFVFSKYEALASLAISVFGQQSFRSVAKRSWWKKRRAAVVTEMQNFDIHVLQWIQSNYSGRLQALTKLPPFLGTDERGRPILSQEQISELLVQEGNVVPTHSRAGLFVWLNACLAGRPTTDDLSMLTYLTTRY